MGDSHVGLQARLMSQALRKLTGAIAKSQHHGRLHQPDPHEDRRDVRQPRDHHGRQRAQVLRLDPPRHPPHRRDQEGRGGDRQPHARQGGEEQDGAAVPRGRVRHPLRRGHLARGRAHRSGRGQPTSIDKSGAWFSFGGERIGQGRENAKQFLHDHPEVYQAIEARVLASHSINPRAVAAAAPPASEGDSEEGGAEDEGGGGAGPRGGGKPPAGRANGRRANA